LPDAPARRRVGIDHRAQHLKIGDQRIHLGDLVGLAVEIAGLRLGIALGQIGVGIGIGLRLQVVVGLGDVVLV
jgi:hypothetical protein